MEVSVLTFGDLFRIAPRESGERLGWKHPG